MIRALKRRITSVLISCHFESGCQLLWYFFASSALSRKFLSLVHSSSTFIWGRQAQKFFAVIWVKTKWAAKFNAFLNSVSEKNLSILNLSAVTICLENHLSNFLAVLESIKGLHILGHELSYNDDKIITCNIIFRHIIKRVKKYLIFSTPSLLPIIRQRVI